ncbi:hypothetical protein LX80_01445 [Hydrotalea sandarakina]|uniref:Carboxypeptidase-like protein n=1 Tax=Hydrotalea sandarakina TaxID=1004304 RepID=A0A2W7RQV3_9BACT|nr:hypothetical protein LX80_01445 [Hydrotalea sandarakina]
MNSLTKYIYLLSLLIFAIVEAHAQQPSKAFTIKGTVYDITARRPIEAVAVLTSSGKGTLTDSLGKYSITVFPHDSIWFSLINKTTMKYPVDTISNTEAFDVQIFLNAFNLPDVSVRNRSYKLDSIQNRQDYAKIFNFRKPGLRLSNGPSGYNPGSVTVGLDLDEIINLFRRKRNQSIESLQRRLIQQEQDAYIDHRFNKGFVRKITGLTSPQLDSFMVKYRPDYDILKMLNDLEFGYYVEQCYKQYMRNLGLDKYYFRKEDTPF